ncbi:hypothetical protein Q8W71_05475 [Methylobacterium sp. NEAU 140]|uniref:hypothetical protein n=1 Tax=Methylobacterium sp. NEAU 140 TaxID=3064945 RepID=UPI0027372829|nr:hypothetical protein [Methylobacterium sp. NEAU 140]MDP4022063.1 hypothetical protein [Methylobacterium sp. NEAU 140]
MLVPAYILPMAEAQAFDHLSDDEFFARFPDVTHRTRPWAPCLVNEDGWLIFSRRDGYRARIRRHLAPTARMEIVIIAQPPADSDLSFDHGPSLGITGAMRHAQ